jgi:hypothetical protein
MKIVECGLNGSRANYVLLFKILPQFLRFAGFSCIESIARSKVNIYGITSLTITKENYVIFHFAFCTIFLTLPKPVKYFQSRIAVLIFLTAYLAGGLGRNPLKTKLDVNYRNYKMRGP